MNFFFFKEKKFDLSNNTATYYIFKDSNNNDLTIIIRDLEINGNNLYLSGSVFSGGNSNAAYIKIDKIDTTNLSGSYYIYTAVNDNNMWGNIPTANSLLLLGGQLRGNEFRLLPINNP